MKKIYLLLFLLSSFIVFGQNIIYKDLKSIEIGGSRTLKIYVPPSFNVKNTRLYPLTILLDGDFLFDVYVGNANLFAKRDKAPEQIIVGIVQGEKRYTDCSYSKVNSLPTEDGEKFYRFIRGEVMDYLESTYPLSPFRTIVGSTLTANFINFFAIEDVPAFDAYININPSYSPDIASYLEHKYSSLKGRKVYYYLNSGNYNTSKKHANIINVASMLNNLNKDDLVLKLDKFNSTETASIGQAIPGSLAHVFRVYSAISKEEFDSKIAHLSPPDAIAYLETKYVEIEYLFGTNMKIRERDIFAIESIIIDKEDGIYLEDFGEMIFRLYPKSPLSDYYIGMYYEKGKKYSKALKHYKNGYAKMDQDGKDAEAYYKNIERILDAQDAIVAQEKKEKNERKQEKEIKKRIKKELKAKKRAEKEAEKAIKRAEKKALKEEKRKEKEALKAIKQAKKEKKRKEKEALKAMKQAEKEKENNEEKDKN